MGSDLGSWPLIMLAAGKSERMGQPKGLMAVRGQPLVQWQIEQFRRAGGAEIVVVLGESADAYLARCSDLPHVVNRGAELGPFSSLQVGLSAACAKEAGAVFVLPVDVPAARPSTWAKLASAYAHKIDVVRPSYQNRRGHPVVLSRSFAERLLALDPTSADARLDVQIRQLAAIDAGAVIDVTVDDPSVLLNLNDPVALDRWLSSVD